MDFDQFHQTLRTLYDQMMPLCGNMIGIAKGIAGLGALFYVAYRVWQSLSRAEPVDVYPLLRPFAIGLCIMFFPSVVLGTINSIMSPVVQGTNGMLQSETLDMQKYAQIKDKLEYEAMRRNPETAYLVDNDIFEERLDQLGITDAGEIAGMYIERGLYQTKKWIREAFREVLEIIFKAAALIIDVIRTFFLIVLSILGPLAFAISVWDGFQSTLTQWITRYISVYLWLPVSDLFSTILARLQSLMLQSDIERMQADPNFSLDSSDAIYIVFLIIGIVGYFTIPTVAGWIISAGGMGNFGKNVNSTATRGAAIAGGAAGAATGNIAGRLKGSGSSSSGGNSGNSGSPGKTQ
ncbi:conjugative transposon protein TraJ [Dysgonomonas sp. GY75]|uniref:conjugative transposon protein TraJ n=1 Tax=Dysgonomonas sp. GY75 TaxID=2780419 RepID=UPI0018832D03|nr:conjugative transposon protein TraJ [Dysgonomonas sp. GY75]MBF0651562.1 conjugative transposon protein TraJ [Dysgonomonas sp. GY75]